MHSLSEQHFGQVFDETIKIKLGRTAIKIYSFRLDHIEEGQQVLSQMFQFERRPNAQFVFENSPNISICHKQPPKLVLVEQIY